MKAKSFTPHIMFRVDASADMGVGHVIRCLALIEAFTKLDCTMSLHTSEMPDYLQDEVKRYGVFVDRLTCHDVTETLCTFYAKKKVKLLVLDGYQFEHDFLCLLQQSGCNVALFDDINDRASLPVNAVINACPDAALLGYDNTASESTKFLGLKYAMLNPALLKFRDTPFEQRKNIIICFGGTDAKGLTLQAMSMLNRVLPTNHGYKVQVVTGKLVSNLAVISKTCQQLGFYHHIQPENLATLISESKLALAAPGNLVYELAYFRVPSILFTVADNQKVSAQYHHNIGWAMTFDGLCAKSKEQACGRIFQLLERPHLMKQLYDASEGLIDGQGANRLAQRLMEIVSV